MLTAEGIMLQQEETSLSCIQQVKKWADMNNVLYFIIIWAGFYVLKRVLLGIQDKLQQLFALVHTLTQTLLLRILSNIYSMKSEWVS